MDIKLIDTAIQNNKTYSKYEASKYTIYEEVDDKGNKNIQISKDDKNLPDIIYENKTFKLGAQCKNCDLKEFKRFIDSCNDAVKIVNALNKNN